MSDEHPRDEHHLEGHAMITDAIVQLRRLCFERLEPGCWISVLLLEIGTLAHQTADPSAALESAIDILERELDIAILTDNEAEFAVSQAMQSIKP